MTAWLSIFLKPCRRVWCPSPTAPLTARLDIITDGKDGVLVDYMDEEQFAEKLLELMRDPGRIERMSAAAKERANDFDVAKIAVEWMKKYKTLLRHHS